MRVGRSTRSSSASGELLDDLDDRPVGDALAVGRQRPAHDARVEPDERNSAASRDLPTPAGPRTVNSWQAALGHARLEGARGARAARGSRPTNGASRRARTPRSPQTDRSRCADTGSLFPFSSSGVDGLDLDGVAHQLKRLAADQDLARLRGLLEPRGHVDGVPGREPLLGARHDLARLDADPTLDPELGQRVPHLDGGPQRPQRVVLVHDRHAEDGHHRVADELLDRAAVALDDRLHPVEVAREQRTQRLRVESTRRAPSTRSRRRRAR